MRKNLVWINVCETSADNYGAMLMQELKQLDQDLEIMGMGGPAMRDLGLKTVFRSEDLSLVGLTEVFSALPRILGFLKKIKALLREKRPAVLILMDAPDFNFRLARMAYNLGIPVLYYITPQVWAWRKSRVYFLRKYVDRIACILPFEEEFFRNYGIEAHFVGHPVMEYIDLPGLEKVAPEKKRVVILPGSRKKEISSLLPVFFRAAEVLRKDNPELVFDVIQAPGVKMEFLRQFCPERPWFRFIPPEHRHEHIRKSTMAVAASGTVTLECAILEVPTIVAYKLSWISSLVGRLLIRVKYISIPNLIMDREVFPELIQGRANVDNIVSVSRAWLNSQDGNARLRADLANIKSVLGNKSATKTCAGLILELIKKGKINGKN